MVMVLGMVPQLSEGEQWARFLGDSSVQDILEEALSDRGSERPPVQPAASWAEFFTDPVVQRFIEEHLPQ